MGPETIIENIELIKCGGMEVQIDHYQIDIKTGDSYERIFIEPSKLLKMLSEASEKVENIDKLKDIIAFLQKLMKNPKAGEYLKQNGQVMTLQEMNEEILKKYEELKDLED